MQSFNSVCVCYLLYHFTPVFMNLSFGVMRQLLWCLSALQEGFHRAPRLPLSWAFIRGETNQMPPTASNPALILKWDLLKAGEWKHNKRNDANRSTVLLLSLSRLSSSVPDLDLIFQQYYSLSFSLSIPEPPSAPSDVKWPTQVWNFCLPLQKEKCHTVIRGNVIQ